MFPRSIYYKCAAGVLSLTNLLTLPAFAISPGNPVFGEAHPTSLTKKVGILGKDQRKPIPDKYKPLMSSIGLLYQDKGNATWACTSFCVAPDVIATNAHCFTKSRRSRKYDLQNVIFRQPGFFVPHSSRLTKSDAPYKLLKSRKNGEFHRYYQAQQSRLVIVDPKLPFASIYAGRYGGRVTLKKQGQDWAFAKLERPICRHRNLEFRSLRLGDIQKASKKNKIFMIGYHGNYKGNRIEKLISDNCRVYSRSNKRYFPNRFRRQAVRGGTLIPHNCDSELGSSGSPLLMRTRTGLKVVGINLGGFSLRRELIRKDAYTGRIVSRKKIGPTREINLAVQPHGFLKGLNRYASEKLLTTSEQFMELQRHLQTLKLYNGPIDGLVGGGTRRAILRYEKKMKLTRLGIGTIRLLELLRQSIDDIKGS